ncbi:hypothetical protein L1987_54554 [Smallanthus sonchifolius]|uniref:Uncharacterized protein n=1 Tax=Smallanthus sonchifolius TaxID=185202 RepID=A0ACB9E717_9ASTR|nr:hypothetical protein L1987_54554 [Smallanthus sonchifolius]
MDGLQNTQDEEDNSAYTPIGETTTNGSASSSSTETSYINRRETSNPSTTGNSRHTQIKMKILDDVLAEAQQVDAEYSDFVLFADADPLSYKEAVNMLAPFEPNKKEELLNEINENWYFEVVAIESLCLLEMSSSLKLSQAPSQQHQRSFSKWISSQHNAIFSQFSQNPQDDTVTTMLSAATAAGALKLEVDYDFPLEGDVRISHTSAIVAGNNGIHVQVQGYEFGKASGMAPRC